MLSQAPSSSDQRLIRRSFSKPFALLGLVTLGGVALGLTGCGADQGAAGQAGPPKPPPALVRVAAMEQKPLAPKVIVMGSVTPVRTSVVASGANGVVERFDAEQGEYVTEGTILSKLQMESANREVEEGEATLRERQHVKEAASIARPEDVAHAEAMLLAAKAVEANARQKWERTQTLHSRGAANDAEFEDAQEKFKAATQAAIAAHQNNERTKFGAREEEKQQALASFEAQEARVGWLKTERDKRTTRAPFNGFVVEEKTHVGQWLSKGDPVVTLAELDHVEVVVHVDQWDLAHVRIGQQTAVIVEGAEDPQYFQWPGTIVQIVPQSDWKQGSRGFPVLVRVKNVLRTIEVTDETGEKKERLVPMLKAGMMARVTIEGPELSALLVPKDALVRTTRGTFIFVFDPADKNANLDKAKPSLGGVRQVPVVANLKLSDGNMIEVQVDSTQPGSDVSLKAGTWVVTEGGERLAPVQEVNALLHSAIGNGEVAASADAEPPKETAKP